MAKPKFRVLRGHALTAWLKSHPKLAAKAKALHVTMLLVRIRVRHPKNVSARALALAARYVGLKEHPAGSNIQMFGRWYGENGVPWCAIFVSYVLSHSGRAFKYAYVPAIVSDARNARNHLRRVSTSNVNTLIRAGHPVLACYDWNHDGTADHVELVVSISGTTVHTIGGNTGPADWSNGGEVARESRPVSYVELFVGVLS